MKLYVFQDIRLTRGYIRSTLCDLSRNNYHFIPNELFDLLSKYNKVLSIKDILKIEDDINCDLYDEYFNFLLKNNYITEIPNELIESFPDMEFVFEYPFLIENIYFVVTSNNICNIEKLFQLGIVNITKNYTFLIDTDIGEEDIIKFTNNISNLTICFQKIVVNRSINIKNKLIEVITFNGNINDDFFKNDTVKKSFPKFYNNIILYTESKNHHTFFNRSIFINSNGLILRHYLDKNNFGNIFKISDKELIQIISDKEFRKYWNIKKDNTNICEVCELRMMCVDIRVPKKLSKTKWGHNEECSYNPYVAKWKGEKDYITINEIGTFNSNNIFVPDKKKINEINNKIWLENI